MLRPEIKKLAQAPNFATITTLMQDGSPATHVMWVDADDDYILINTETGRAKYENVRQDPRVSVVIWDRDDPYSYAEIRGRVVETTTGVEARQHIDELSYKYNGREYTTEIKTERVILKIAPERQRLY
ncbi:MAG: PPOX class F420-dependent oxidoreductase [Actinomycetota bacterium]|nr:PPOX class F420-dependent oxidoreductase [Actinomycetota bacterium]